ncbi:hypothetical protein SLS62_011384 [Diatrype stigma]|uniref:6-phosphogluconate dehydrogenase n=1 Tax=Diatrype stigma TaxID=117547 RepID=A0AAN9U426_9PEZI
MAAPLAKIGILSIGDMGMGIAKLLVAHGFAVATNCSGRSNDTIQRAQSAQVELLASDADLVRACPVILSVVPPRDAAATAQRVLDAVRLFSSSSRSSSTGGDGAVPVPAPLYFADLNAVAPSTIKSIAARFGSVGGTETETAPAADVRFVDGSIIGGPPALRRVGGDGDAKGEEEEERWSVPSIPTSGPHKLSDIPGYGERLFGVLNMRHIGPEIGSASGLKMCFASTSKGLTALAIQSFTTAHRLGVLGELRREMGARLPPALLAAAERGLVGMPPKAYRWVREMEEIALTFEEEGGFVFPPSGGDHEAAAGPSMFRGAAEIYKAIAEDTVLGAEKVGDRKRGRDAEDVARAVAEGLQEKKRKREMER